MKLLYKGIVASVTAALVVSCGGGSSTITDTAQGNAADPLDQLGETLAAQSLADQEFLSQIVSIPEVTQLGYPAEDVPTVGSALPLNSGLDPWGRPRQAFVNWETPHVHPLDITPNGALVLAVNTAANTLMIFDDNGGAPSLRKAVPVGLDPVSVRAFSNSQAWVANLASDSVSVVDLDLGVVVHTLHTEDEPADIVFAGSPQKAFVTASQVNRVNVFDPFNLNAARQSIFINGEDPRAMAVSPDGSKVYVSVFESGNATTLINGGTNNRHQVDYISRSDSPYGGENVPPNNGDQIDPPVNPALPTPPPISIIVRKQDDGRWLDDNQGDWTYVASPTTTLGAKGSRVAGWDLPDRDVAIIDSGDLSVTYQSGLMNALMAIGVHPDTGDVLVVGTDSTNEVRYEPNLRGTFMRVLGARVTEAGAKQITDLNPHLDYQTETLPAAQRMQSVGDPRAVAFAPDGSFALVSGMGSNNVIVVDSRGARLRDQPIVVGEGPTGVVVHPGSQLAYVLNKFEGSLSVVSTSIWQQIAKVRYYDPTPGDVKAGRRHFYNTHETSGLGTASCAACHIDARTDRLAWDLGDPGKDLIVVDGKTFHPMKGPLLTQTLQDAMRHRLLHWRGDVENLSHGFTNTREGLQGDDRGFTAQEMAQMETFLDSIHMPSNPNRNLDNSYNTSLDIPGPNDTVARTGNAALGAQQFENTCRRCHLGHNARGDTAVAAFSFGLDQLRLSPTWRGFHERFGIWFDSADGSNTGFGTQQNGSFDSTHNDTRNNDMMAFMQSVTGRFPYTPGGDAPHNQSQDTHAAVGQQITFNGALTGVQRERLDLFLQLADRSEVGLIAKSFIGDVERGFAYMADGELQADANADNTTLDSLLARVQGESLQTTITVVPAGSELRLGVDADMDNSLDLEEALGGTDPLDPDSFLPADCSVVQEVAQLSSTRHSSGWNGDRFPSVLAIDGDPDTFSHTASNDDNATFWLDLNADYTLAELELVNRTNCCGERLRDLTVTFFDRDGNVVHEVDGVNAGNALNNPASITLPFNGELRARRIRISRQATPSLGRADDRNVLSLGEVNVKACSSSFIEQLPAPVPQQNLLSNGSFESGSSDWLSCSDGVFSSSTDSASGNFALHVGSTACAYQEFPIQQGNTYTLRCSAKHDGDAFGSVTLAAQTSTFEVLESAAASVVSSRYATYQSVIDAPSVSAIGVATLYGENGASFDDCSVVEGVVPATTPSTDVLANGGFEEDTNQWQSCGPVNGFNLSRDAASGQQALRLASEGCLYQEFAMQGSEGITLSCLAKAEGNGYASVRVTSNNAIYQEVLSHEVEIESIGYDTVIAEIPATASARIGVVTLYSDDTAHIDSCVVTRR